MGAAPVGARPSDVQSVSRSCSCASSCLGEHTLVVSAFVCRGSDDSLNTPVTSGHASILALGPWSSCDVALLYVKVPASLPGSCSVLSLLDRSFTHLGRNILRAEEISSASVFGSFVRKDLVFADVLQPRAHLVALTAL